VLITLARLRFTTIISDFLPRSLNDSYVTSATINQSTIPVIFLDIANRKA